MNVVLKMFMVVAVVSTNNDGDAKAWWRCGNAMEVPKLQSLLVEMVKEESAKCNHNIDDKVVTCKK